ATLVAEGVETAKQLAFLTNAVCGRFFAGYRRRGLRQDCAGASTLEGKPRTAQSSGFQHLSDIRACPLSCRYGGQCRRGPDGAGSTRLTPRWGNRPADIQKPYQNTCESRYHALC